MLEVKDVVLGYEGIPAIHGVSLSVDEGEVVSVIGANGAGKTTLLRGIAGVLHPERGEITFGGRRIDRDAPHDIVARGVAHVPEGRKLFGSMTVRENLEMGAYAVQDRVTARKTLAWIFDVFPVLAERAGQRADTLSGGEQQMLAIGRGLMSNPRLIMLDEPSLGIMPRYVTRIFDVIRDIRARGTTVLLVEQNVEKALRIADRAYVLQTGRIVLSGAGHELLSSDLVRESYLGL